MGQSFTFVAQQAPPSRLERDWLLAQFGKLREQAVAPYEKFVLDGIDQASPLLATRHQKLLGDDAFVSANWQGQNPDTLVEVVSEERRAVALPFSEGASRNSNRNEETPPCVSDGGVYHAGNLAPFRRVHNKCQSRPSEFENGF
jgi:hypothetical protein